MNRYFALVRRSRTSFYDVIEAKSHLRERAIGPGHPGGDENRSFSPEDSYIR